MPRNRKLRLRRETVRALVADEMIQIRGAEEGISRLLRKTIQTILSDATACPSACITDPPTCLCPSFGCES